MKLLHREKGTPTTGLTPDQAAAQSKKDYSAFKEALDDASNARDLAQKAAAEKTVAETVANDPEADNTLIRNEQLRGYTAENIAIQSLKRITKHTNEAVEHSKTAAEALKNGRDHYEDNKDAYAQAATKVATGDGYVPALQPGQPVEHASNVHPLQHQ